ncbi:TetR/AcrR family transcriptional regulator [Vineibacter terrae]|nr:TetR/AcrR family transcriptional regulator [Vineibacter terrae]
MESEESRGQSATPLWRPGRRRRAPAYDIKREAVIATAARLFQEKGYRNTTLNDIAAALNVTKPTIYYYVQNKDEILAECRARVWGGITKVIQAASDSRKNGREKVELFVRSYAEAISTDYGKCLVMTVRDVGGAEAELRKYRQGLREATHVLRDIVAEGIRDGSIAPCDPRMAAFAMYGALNWITYWYDPDGPSNPSEIGEEFVRLFRTGLKPRLER